MSNPRQGLPLCHYAIRARVSYRVRCFVVTEEIKVCAAALRKEEVKELHPGCGMLTMMLTVMMGGDSVIATLNLDPKTYI